MAQVQEMAQEIINNIIRELEQYHANGNWGKFFNESVMGCLTVSHDGKRIDIAGCVLSVNDENGALRCPTLLGYEGPHIELVCGRGYGRISYSCRDIEIKREIDGRICEEIIDFLEKATV
jgi:hypothetical protein